MRLNKEWGSAAINESSIRNWQNAHLGMIRPSRVHTRQYLSSGQRDGHPCFAFWPVMGRERDLWARSTAFWEIRLWHFMLGRWNPTLVCLMSPCSSVCSCFLSFLLSLLPSVPGNARWQDASALKRSITDRGGIFNRPHVSHRAWKCLCEVNLCLEGQCFCISVAAEEKNKLSLCQEEVMELTFRNESKWIIGVPRSTYSLCCWLL